MIMERFTLKIFGKDSKRNLHFFSPPKQAMSGFRINSILLSSNEISFGIESKLMIGVDRNVSNSLWWFGSVLLIIVRFNSWCLILFFKSCTLWSIEIFSRFNFSLTCHICPIVCCSVALFVTIVLLMLKLSWKTVPYCFLDELLSERSLAWYTKALPCSSFPWITKNFRRTETKSLTLSSSSSYWNDDSLIIPSASCVTFWILSLHNDLTSPDWFFLAKYLTPETMSCFLIFDASSFTDKEASFMNNGLLCRRKLICKSICLRMAWNINMFGIDLSVVLMLFHNSIVRLSLLLTIS